MKTTSLLALAMLLISCSGGDPIIDAGTDGGPDAGHDAGHDAGTDAGPRTDAGTDGGTQLQCPSPDDGYTPPTPRAYNVPAHESWSARVGPTSPFLASSGAGDFEGPSVLWVKFSILLEDPDTVYFQNSTTHPFHYDFARQRIPDFAALTAEEFDSISLHNDGRKLLLGAVLFPGQSTPPTEYGIQFVGADALAPALVKQMLDKVVASVDAPGAKALYMPTPAQLPCAGELATWYANAGYDLGSVDAWLPGDQCYASGWTVGRLVQLSSSELDAATLDGRLTAEDILMLEDGAPAELPAVSGVISLAPSTPNSHTAILAQSYGIPFAYLRQPEIRASALALNGREVLLSAGGLGRCEVEIFDLTNIDSGIVEMLRQMSRAPAISYTPKATSGSLSAPVDGLSPADIAKVGGKAANYGVLRTVLPDNSRPAVALTMDLWEAFMDQTIGPDSRTLRAEIDARLSVFAWPPNMTELDRALAEVRDLIKDDAEFSAGLQADVQNALGGFDSSRKLRFRSSTNVEDSSTFTGAGLYDSVSGCLADDLDGDDIGPSLCNPDKRNERGVFRAIKKVYASFYRRNAFAARLQRGVIESEVGMSVLVHHSFPDETELANGVVTFNRGFSDQLEIVSQPGAFSVTNSDSSAKPEEVSVYRFSQDVYPELRSGSALLPLGATVLTWDQEYIELTRLLALVADHLQAGDSPLSLDFEYKKIENEGLVVKQVRPLPAPDTTRDVAPLLLSSQTRLCVDQGESSDVFALHRMKSIWDLQSLSAWMDTAGLSSTLLQNINLEYVHEGNIETMQGAPMSLPGYRHAVGMHSSTASSDDTFDAQGRSFTLIQQVPELRTRSQSPAMGIDKMYLQLRSDYATPVAFRNYDGTFVYRSEEYANLSRNCPDEFQNGPEIIEQQRTITSGAVTIQTAFYWPPGPGFGAGYTAPLIGWDETTITGLTSTPIVLRNNWSQTTRPEHHNFGANYLFEPRLEPGVPASIIAELEAADIRMIYGNEQNEILLVGLDGVIRPL